MPEGDTLHRIAVNLRKAILHQVVTRFYSPLPHVATQDAHRPVAGRAIQDIQARGKNLLIVLREADACVAPAATPASLDLSLYDSDLVLHSHLRMTGSWHIYRHGEAWQKPRQYAKASIETENLLAVCFSAPIVELLTARELARHASLTALGPDAMRDDFDPGAAAARIRARPDLPVGVAIMAQSAMAGVGNEFKSEILFRKRVNPFAKVGDLPAETLAGLIDEAHALLRVNAAYTRRRTRFELDPRKRVWVYGRAGEPCDVCGAPIQVRRQGLEGRTTYYCVHCQNVLEITNGQV